MNHLDILFGVCKIENVCDANKNITHILKKELEKYSEKIIINSNASIISKIKTNTKKNKPIKIVLEAHIDCIGLMVKDITDEGFLKVQNYGGIDPKVFFSKEVVVCGKKNITGFVFKKNSDNSENEKNNVITTNDMLVDLLLEKKEVEKYVKKGDSIYFKFNPIKLQNGKVCVRFLDNRVSVFAILLILEKLKNIDVNCDIFVIFSSFEETTQLGAITANNYVDPDIAICLDTSFAKDLNKNENNIGGVMGNGPLICISPILDKDLTNCLIETAKKNDIPHQLEINNGSTHTNADALLTTKCGVKTLLLSIPIRYMHTPIESVNISDVYAAVDLMCKFICSQYPIA